MNRIRAFSLGLGPALGGLVWALPSPDGLTQSGQGSLAVLAFCMVWWLFTPVPLPVTSLLGLALIPTLGVLPPDQALALFGNQAVFFVIGVFLIAAVVVQTGLSARFALMGLKRVARNEDALCVGVLLLSFSLCGVVVSHAVAALMLPIVLEVIRSLRLRPRSPTARRLLLSMAWGTVCGSNLTLLSSARASLGLELYRGTAGDAADVPGFVAYSLGAAPMAFISVVVVGVLLRVLYPPQNLDLTPAVAALGERVQGLGKVRGREKAVVGVVGLMVITMVLWGPQLGLGTVALLFSGLLFALQLLSWEDAERYVNWGVALLYGGAIAVGAALHKTGAALWLVEAILPAEPAALGALVLVLAVAFAVAALTELVSNAAVVAMMMPVALPIAAQIGVDPRTMVWLVPVAAGFAFVLPTSTPALAMVFGTGYLHVRDTLPGVVVTGVSLLALLGLWTWVWPLILGGVG